MWTRATIAALSGALAFVGCTTDRIEDQTKVAAAPLAPADVVVVEGGEGATGLRTPAGSVVYTLDGAIWAPDGRTLYRAEAAGQRTSIFTVDASTGKDLSETAVHGEMEPVVASGSGRAVALVNPARWGDLDPAPRSRTTIIVADPTGDRRPLRFDLRGNYEPEAFSTDDARLFMIQHVPALVPSAYRVTSLDLRTGEVSPVRGGFDTPSERMAGSRLGQLWRPDGGQLFTLYSNQPTLYAQRAGGVEPPPHGVTFVHVLDVDTGWTYCVGLPLAMSRAEQGDLAMAGSPDSGSLYVVDAKAGVVARMDTGSLKVTATGHLPIAPLESTQVLTSADGQTLYVADTEGILLVDAVTFAPGARWTLPASPSSLGLSPDGLRLFAAVSGAISVIDVPSGKELAVVPFELDAGIREITVA